MSLGYSFGRLLKTCLFLSIFVIQELLAQGSGTIRGTVYDESANDELPGANVILRGTSIGAATDLDGKYVLRNIPAGSQTIVASYLGYISDTIVVNVQANRVLELDFSLSATAVEGEEVLVTAQAQGQLEAINQQLSSNKISNVVSETRIQELPDFNAAQTIGRLSGVSTLQSSGEANKIVIRGLAPQYNSVQVEGIRLSSTGSTQIGATSLGLTSGAISTDRSVDLSMISPYMLKTISVYKSLTPDLNANSIGGTVNMELREAPAEFHTDILWQSGYTEKSDDYSNYRGVVSLSKRFFDDKFGAYILGNIESYDRNADNMNASYVIRDNTVIGENGYHPVEVNNVQLNRHIETRQRYGGNIILDYQIPSGSIKMINMFSRLNSDYQDFRTILDYRSSSKNLDFTYREGENSLDVAVNSLAFEYDFGIMQMDIKAANTYSFNNLPHSPYLQFRQNGGVGGGPTPVDTRPEELTNLVNYRGAGETYLRNLSIFSSKYKESNQYYSANFEFPVAIGSDISGYFKLGGVFQYDHHTNNQEAPYISLNTSGTFAQELMDSLVAVFGIQYDSSAGLFAASNFTSGDNDLYEAFLDNRFGAFYWATDPGIPMAMAEYLSTNPRWRGRNSGGVSGGWYNGLYEQIPNDYKYIERYYAGYLMTELNFLDFMIVGGVRYEKDKSLFETVNMRDNRNPDAQPYFPITVYPENEFWLPMVQVKYQPLDWVDVRYAFTQTLARPDYHQLSPHSTISSDGLNVWAGNPDLKTAQAFNHDLIFTFHNNELGLLSVGGFYKTIKDFTYYTQYKLHQTAPPGLDSINSFNPRPNEGATLYTYLNTPYNAYIKGIEVDIQTRLWYLPFPFSGTIIGINYTKIESEATYPWRDDRTYRPPRPLPPYTEVFDSTRKGRLINQPNDILNAYFGYDFEGFSMRLSFIFQGNSVSGIGAFEEQDGFTHDYFRIDASVRQILPWYGIEIYLDLNNLNSETNQAAQQSIGGFTNEQNYGLTGNMGVRYRL